MIMDFDKFSFRQIDAHTEIKSFDCGDADLNDFLFSDAIMKKIRIPQQGQCIST